MAKIYGLNGVLSGRIGASVFAVRNGENIARKYQPVVQNPNTPAQVETRAKLKLASQLSAVMAPYIAIPKQGPVSSRNLFIRANYGALTYADNTASVDLSEVKLTTSVVGLPEIGAVAGAADSVDVSLSKAVADISRVVYVAVLRQADGTLRAAGSIVVSNAGLDGKFSGNIPIGTSLPVQVYAYGVRDNTEAASVAFGNMEVDAAYLANLITTRRLTERDITLTETKSTTSESA